MAKRKNIIFYFSDQQRWDTVNETVTPNLMQLAKEGTLLRTTLPASRCAARPVPACKPVCMLPSAAATGTGIPLPESITPLAHYFNEAGYDTAYVGKWHFGL